MLAHVLLFVILAVLWILVPEFGLLLASFMVAEQVYDSGLTDYLYYCAFIEDVEYFELVL